MNVGLSVLWLKFRISPPLVLFQSWEFQIPPHLTLSYPSCITLSSIIYLLPMRWYYSWYSSSLRSSYELLSTPCICVYTKGIGTYGAISGMISYHSLKSYIPLTGRVGARIISGVIGMSNIPAHTKNPYSLLVKQNGSGIIRELTEYRIFLCIQLP